MEFTINGVTITRRRRPSPRRPGNDALQEHIDTFYWTKGPCCAGCDWWRSYNSSVGQCTRSAPVTGWQRAAMLGIGPSSLHVGAGHAMTRREHHCGDFRDQFDWLSLPAAYLRKIGHRHDTSTTEPVSASPADAAPGDPKA